VHRNVEIFVSGENIFDEEYISDGLGGELGAPRQFSGGLRVRF
jgi:outer membrane receptor protein involved in Fe transport